VLSNCVLKDMAVCLDGLMGKAAVASSSNVPGVKALTPLKRSNPLRVKDRSLWPLTFGQESMLFMSKVSVESNTALNIYFAAEVRAEAGKFIDKDALRKASGSLIMTHEALRTVYVDVDNVSYANVLPENSLDFGAQCFSCVKVGSEKDMEKAVESAANLPFDLSSGPILRITLFECDSCKPLLLFAVHHIASDLWSLMIMMKDFNAAYDAAILDASYKSTSLLSSSDALRMVDYAAWQRENYSSKSEGVGPASEGHWRDTFKDISTMSPLEFPLDKNRPVKQTFVGRSFKRIIPATLANSVNSLVRRMGTTTYSAILATYSAVLSRHTGSEDIVVGTPLANRSAAVDLENIVGYFINPVPMRTYPHSSQSFESLLKDVTGVVMTGIGNQDYPFPLLVDKFGGKRDASRSPVFQTMVK
jgi:hypothetical protein